MAPEQSKLYSEGTVAQRDVTGEPSQVYDMFDAAAWIIKQVEQKNAISIFRIDYDCQWLHIYTPQIVNDLHGKSEFVVGNSSDVLGEYKLIKIPITKLRYFPIIGESGRLPVNPEVDNTIERSYLSNGPLATLEDPRIALLNSWLVGFTGKKLPCGDVRSLESASDMECMGGGFKNWHFWALKHLNTDHNDAFYDAIDAIHCASLAVRYIWPAGSTRDFDESLMGSALRVSAGEYPGVEASIQSIFLGASGPFAAHGVPPAVNTSGTTVVVKDARDAEKEVTARQGQARMALFNVGGKIDGKVTDLTYGTPSIVMEGINAMLRASRADQFAQASTRAHRQAKKRKTG